MESGWGGVRKDDEAKGRRCGAAGEEVLELGVLSSPPVLGMDGIVFRGLDVIQLVVIGRDRISFSHRQLKRQLIGL